MSSIRRFSSGLSLMATCLVRSLFRWLIELFIKASFYDFFVLDKLLFDLFLGSFSQVNQDFFLISFIKEEEETES